MYKVAKAADWGDMMPANVREIPKPVTRWELWSKAVGYIPAKKGEQQLLAQTNEQKSTEPEKPDN